MLNNITLMGRFVKNPELRMTSNQTPVASFCLAVDRDYSSGDEKVTDFINCVAWRKTGEFIAKYFAQGDLIAVVGSLQMRDWTDRDGNKRRSYEVNIDRANFAGTKKKESAEQAPALEELENNDGELPF